MRTFCGGRSLVSVSECMAITYVPVPVKPLRSAAAAKKGGRFCSTPQFLNMRCRSGSSTGQRMRCGVLGSGMREAFVSLSERGFEYTRVDRCSQQERRRLGIYSVTFLYIIE